MDETCDHDWPLEWLPVVGSEVIEGRECQRAGCIHMQVRRAEDWTDAEPTS